MMMTEENKMESAVIIGKATKRLTDFPRGKDGSISSTESKLTAQNAHEQK
jgi:hypothetical protein